MTLGLSFDGTYPVSGFLSKGPSPSEWLAKFAEWLAAREGEELVGSQVVEGPEGDVLLAQLHPFAEEIQVTCPRLGAVTLTASTGSCGPGYHEHVVDLVHAMASELKVSWSASEDADDTGFARTGDRAALERTFVEHGAELARCLRPGGAAPPSLFLPPTSPGFLHDEAVSTPLGPRGEAWLTAARSGDARVLDALPWRSRGRSAEYHAARGLALAWCEARWREPVNEAEEGVLREIVRCFEAGSGSALVPDCTLREVQELLGDEEPAGGGARGGKPIGYRRGDLIARLPGDFTMRLPGSFSDEMDDDGTWHGSDGDRTVYASAGRLPPVADTPGDAVRALARTAFEGEPHEFRGERIVGKGALREDEDDGRPVRVLACGAAQGSYLLRATIVCGLEPSEREWALATFRSIDRGGSQAEIGDSPSVPL